MKVLHVSGARSWGGNEQQLMFLVDELPKYGVEQYLFCFQDTPLHKEAKEHPVTIRAIGKTKPYKSDYRKSLKDVVQEEEIDLIHLHTSDSVTGFVITDMIFHLKTPTVFAKKGVRDKNSFLSKFKYNYKNIDRIICISDYVRKNFKTILKEKNHQKLVTVYNGVRPEEDPRETFDLRERLGLSSETFLFGNIANHTKAKDHMMLLKAVEHLVKKKPAQKFHLVQAGSFSKLTPEFQQEVARAGLQSYVTFLDFVPDASLLMPQLDALVISSRREGGPSSLMEAFHKKTPVISTRVGVVEEVIEDGVNGFSVEAGDAAGLAHKMKEFMENPELGDKFRNRSYDKFLKKFTAKHLGENTFRVYKDLLNSKSDSKFSAAK